MPGEHLCFVRVAMSIVALPALLVIGACGSLDDKSRGPGHGEKTSQQQELRGHIVATERAAHGGRLVMVGENGDRVDELTRIGQVQVRDNSPAWSPDGRWIVFASSRARDELTQTSLWIVAAAPDAQPRRLTTHADALDGFPTFTPDGRAVVFASNREGNFDLWRLPLTTRARGVPTAASAPERISSGPAHDFHPSFSPNGERLVFTRLRADGAASQIFMLPLASGAAQQLTEGPFDATPAWSPDGEWIAFAGLSDPLADAPADAPADADAPAGERDADLFLVRPDGTERRTIIREPRADQTGPAWSADGRYVFCTSIYRLGDEPILSSITFVEPDESPPVLRALHDRLAVVSRMEPALGQAPLDHIALRGNLPYVDALDRALEAELLRAQ